VVWPVAAPLPPSFGPPKFRGIPGAAISTSCGNQFPFLSCLIPFYLVKVMCTWKQTFEVWPALLVGGGSFAIFQYFFADQSTSNVNCRGPPPARRLKVAVSRRSRPRAAWLRP